MMKPPELQTAMSEEDAYVRLLRLAETHTPGERRTDDDWPEYLWELADKVAGQREVLPEDADRLAALYEQWQNDLNAEDAEEDSE